MAAASSRQRSFASGYHTIFVRHFPPLELIVRIHLDPYLICQGKNNRESSGVDARYLPLFKHNTMRNIQSVALGFAGSRCLCAPGAVGRIHLPFSLFRTIVTLTDLGLATFLLTARRAALGSLAKPLRRKILLASVNEKVFHNRNRSMFSLEIHIRPHSI
jgi:hypothetical protein